MSYWTEETEAALRNLYSQGRTHMQIALTMTALHGPISTTAIGAKCSRLGLIRGQAKGHASPAKLEEIDHTWPYKHTDTAVLFMDRKPSQCPWPVGPACGAEMMCCGATRVAGTVYCEDHNDAAREKNPRPLSF
jgi:hypothetical protein